jgi:hypothetical protein
MRPSRTLVLAITGVAVAVSACSSEDLAEKATEKAIERQLEAEGNGDVDVDIGDGEFRVETPEGSMVINADGDGNIQIDAAGDDGSVHIEGSGDDVVIETPDGTMVASGNGELPADFPSSIPVPDGASYTSTSSMAGPDGTTYILSGTVDGDFQAATDAFVAALEGSGFTQQSMTTTPDGTFFGYVSAEWNVSGGMYPATDGSGRTEFGLNIFPASG